MQSSKDILFSIKDTINSIDPTATIILYGSFARGDNKIDSDIDLLILLEKVEVTGKDKTKIQYPLYEIEFETGRIISPLVLSKNDWETRHRITPFYENVIKEGIRL